LECLPGQQQGSSPAKENAAQSVALLPVLPIREMCGVPNLMAFL
jgi:hypothetical protein